MKTRGELVRDALADHLNSEQVKIDAAMKQARERIEKAIDQSGPYTHNMISLALRSVAEKFGYRWANDLVRGI